MAIIFDTLFTRPGEWAGPVAIDGTTYHLEARWAFEGVERIAWVRRVPNGEILAVVNSGDSAGWSAADGAANLARVLALAEAKMRSGFAVGNPHAGHPGQEHLAALWEATRRAEREHGMISAEAIAAAAAEQRACREYDAAARNGNGPA